MLDALCLYEILSHQEGMSMEYIPLNPNVGIVKLVFTGVYPFFLFWTKI